MRKKTGFTVLIIIIVLQLCTPIGMIVYKTAETNTIIENGELLKIKIDHMTYSEGKLNLNIYPDSYNWGKMYAKIEISDTGYAELILTDIKPADNIYIKSSTEKSFNFPVTEIKTEKFSNIKHIYFIEETGDESWWDKVLDTRELFKFAYLEAYVYKGKVVPVGVYIDGVELNAYLSRLNEDKK